LVEVDGAAAGAAGFDSVFDSDFVSVFAPGVAGLIAPLPPLP
jgi:hypothetical protein